MKPSESSPAKPPRAQRRLVCVICGKPSKVSICEPCKARVQAEALGEKIHKEKPGKPS